VIIFTDLAPPDETPPNVTFVQCSLDDLRHRFSSVLGFEVCRISPYKTVDFRPAFGLLFSDHLDGCDFWGHGDIDVVYGDLARFLDDDRFGSYDVLSCREQWISGSLSLYRNEPAVVELFRESKDYRTVFTTERHLAFDETSFRWNALRRKPVFDVVFPYENMTLLVKRAAREGRLRAHFKSLAMEDVPDGGVVAWRNGRVLHGDREYAYYHWVTEKRLGKLTFPDWKTPPDAFYATPYGFYCVDPHTAPAARIVDWKRRTLWKARRLLAAGRPEPKWQGGVGCL
jgi:hypothetical protein